MTGNIHERYVWLSSVWKEIVEDIDLSIYPQHIQEYASNQWLTNQEFNELKEWLAKVALGGFTSDSSFEILKKAYSALNKVFPQYWYLHSIATRRELLFRHPLSLSNGYKDETIRDIENDSTYYSLGDKEWVRRVKESQTLGFKTRHANNNINRVSNLLAEFQADIIHKYHKEELPVVVTSTRKKLWNLFFWGVSNK